MVEHDDLFSPDYLEAYLLGRLTQEQVEALDAHLREDPETRRQFARAVEIMSLVREEFQGIQEQSAVQAGEPMLQDFDRLFAELLQAEQAAKPVAVPLVEANNAGHAKADDAGSLSGHDFVAVGGYVLRKALTSKAAVYAYAAAVVLLAVVLINPWSSNETPTDAPFATDNPKMPEASTKSTPRGSTAATLTASHDAKWSLKPGESLRPGDALASGQRLTLTQGFAEITTARGAIAIIEAPATIELSDNDNAIRLHTGKLVGICETDSSKGFLVRTPHMDITDLGTRFGVDATHPDATEVHVIEGTVEAVRPAYAGGAKTRQVLSQGSAVRAEQADDRLARVKAQAQRFTQTVPDNLLLGTGRYQGGGEADRNWRVVAVDGQPVNTFTELTIVPDFHGGTSDPNTSQWIKVNESINPRNTGTVTYTCRAAFTVPAEYSPQTHELSVRCEADFSVKAVRINGQALQVPKNRIRNGWITLEPASNFNAGSNTIEIDVHEFLFDDGRKNSSSLRVEVMVQER